MSSASQNPGELKPVAKQLANPDDDNEVENKNTQLGPSFALFGFLPYELRAQIWEEVGRPTGIPEAHRLRRFVRFLTGPEAAFMKATWLQADIAREYHHHNRRHKQFKEYFPVRYSEAPWCFRLDHLETGLGMDSKLESYLYRVHGMLSACPESREFLVKLNLNKTSSSGTAFRFKGLDALPLRDLVFLEGYQIDSILLGPSSVFRSHDPYCHARSSTWADFLATDGQVFSFEYPVLVPRCVKPNGPGYYSRHRKTAGWLRMAMTNMAVMFDWCWNDDLDDMTPDYLSYEFSRRSFIVNFIKACSRHPERVQGLTLWLVDDLITDSYIDCKNGQKTIIKSGEVRFRDSEYYYVECTPPQWGRVYVGNNSQVNYRYDRSAEKFYEYLPYLVHGPDAEKVDIRKYLRVLVRVPRHLESCRPDYFSTLLPNWSG